jgi:signal transduction histidine kinase/DNA-binding response OmpR family regulator/CHASE3 domain sensor protein
LTYFIALSNYLLYDKIGIRKYYYLEINFYNTSNSKGWGGKKVFLKNFKIGFKLFLGFGIITLLMLSVMVYSYINFSKESQAVRDNLHSNNIINEADATLISLINMETGARGFALTGHENFLVPFNKGKTDFQAHYANLKELTAENYRQQDRLNELKKGYETWLDFETTQIIDVRRKIVSGEMKFEQLIANAQLGKAKAEMDSLRLILEDIKSEETDILKTRREALTAMESQTRLVMSSGGAIALGLAFIIALLVIRMIVKPVEVVTNTFKEISEGDAKLDVKLHIDSNDELGQMARYYNTFVGKLKDIISENISQSWLKTGQAELNEKMDGQQDLQELCSNIVNYTAKYIDAQVGAIYIRNQEDTFKLYGGYAFKRRKNFSSEIKVGEGIIGQAALEKQSILIGSIPEDYIMIGSGTGESVPKNLLVVPCVYNNEVMSVIEFGSFKEITNLQLQFLELVSTNIASAVYSSEARFKMKELLSKTLEQSEELQAQQEELRQNNEELEEQTRALKESESRLQAQQEELRVVNEELEERTKNLELQKSGITAKNESLKRAQSEIERKAVELETASKYKSEFLANMSHELRTPLNSILVLSDILASNKGVANLSDKQLEYARTINSSGKDLLRLINDVLDLSKIEAGKMDINFEEIYIEELKLHVEHSFSAVAAQKGLELKINIEKGVPETIISDPYRIQQILNNLLSNAFKFTHKGSVEVNISKNAVQYQKPLDMNKENLISFSVTDSGIGIPSEKQNLIFEAFKQSDGTTSRKYGGTGLGLSISRELAHLLGGNIYIESEEGKGSTFTLVIPNGGKTPDKISEVITPKGKEENGPEQTIEAFKHDDPLNASIVLNVEEKTMLIVEDDKKFSGVLVDLAQNKGYSCIIAETGSLGLELAKKHKPDAIIMDIGLPDVNGWKIIEKLKEDRNTANIPVHVISGGGQEEISKDMDRVLGYLQKPVELADLDEVFSKFRTTSLHLVKKVLILDENMKDAEGIVNMLKQKEMNSDYLSKGQEALKLLKLTKYDCIIMDLKLEDMNGFQFLYELNKEGLTNTPVIIHTQRKLTFEDELELQKYTDSIIIKGIRSIERLSAEATLFMHDIESKTAVNELTFDKDLGEDTLNGKKVLIVDDDMRNVFALSSILEDKGISVVVARNGRDGLEKLNQNKDVNLVLMDIMMPEMDGYTAMREIRKLEKFKKLPIIAITAKAMREDRDKCIDAGANDYLTKPVDIEKLVSLLRVWLYK